MLYNVAASKRVDDCIRVLAHREYRSMRSAGVRDIGIQKKMRLSPRLFDSTSWWTFYETARTVESVSYMADGDFGARRIDQWKDARLFFNEYSVIFYYPEHVILSFIL